MDAFKIAVKLYVASDVFEPSEFVPVFHRWIQQQAVEGHLLVDVADYAHVPDGPGTVLVSSEANLYMDRGAGRLGLLYARKLPLPGTFRDRLRAVVIEALKAASLLEQEPSLAGRLTFRTDELVVRLNDRLLAPNTPETRQAVAPDIDALARDLYPGSRVSIEHGPSPEALFEVRLKAWETPTIASLAGRLGRLALQARA